MRNSNRRSVLFGLLGAVPAFLAASAQENADPYQPEFDEPEQQQLDEEPIQQQAIQGSERAAQVDLNFDAVMIQNAYAPAPASAPPAKARMMMRPAEGLGGATPGATDPKVAPKVVVPLLAFRKVKDQLEAQRERLARYAGPAVVLGSASYAGEAEAGALRLVATLDLTLGHPDRYKYVPLIGDDVVVVSAKRGEEPIPVAKQNGYHVWVTKETGEVRIALQILVPARGPRGSIEYDFSVARTPVTSFNCRFASAGLEPRLDAAVRSEVMAEGDGTRLSATLRPTTRIHLVGFHDLGDSEDLPAKLYAESLHLLSVEEGSQDLFSVVRYTILYGRTKDFLFLVPEGLEVVSAEGEGAFRYVTEKTPAGTLVRGETAFPIRSNYEISLRLHRDSKKGETSESFAVPLPRAQGVEREHGWIGIEVPGKLRLEEEKRAEVLAVDVRQLPVEMVQSAVSPILLAYRYHGKGAQVFLRATRFAEKDPASASIDRIRATTVLSVEGKQLTDLKITLRNRLRHSLILSLPQGHEVLSTLLDGQPVKPSRNEKGELMLPLKRSIGGERMLPFTLQVVLEGQTPALGWLGRPKLSLPAVDLPVSSIAWTVFLPPRNVYSTLEGDISRQRYAGEAEWHQPLFNPFLAQAEGGGRGPETPAAEASADTGAMPVRIKLPDSGARLEYTRYWMETERPVVVSFFYLRSWLLVPLSILLVVASALGVFLAAGVGRKERLFGAALVVGLAWPLVARLGVSGLLLAALVGVIVRMRPRFPQAQARLLTWWRQLPDAFKARPRAKEGERTFFGTVWRLMLAGGMSLFLFLIAVSVYALVVLLASPLAG